LAPNTICGTKVTAIEMITPAWNRNAGVARNSS
jgi:hypothetical protein